MRYRENMAEPVGAPIDAQMVFGTSAYALVAGLVLCAMGIRGRRYWLVSMGVVLIASSSAYLVSRLVGA